MCWYICVWAVRERRGRGEGEARERRGRPTSVARRGRAAAAEGDTRAAAHVPARAAQLHGPQQRPHPPPRTCSRCGPSSSSATVRTGVRPAGSSQISTWAMSPWSMRACGVRVWGGWVGGGGGWWMGGHRGAEGSQQGGREGRERAERAPHEAQRSAVPLAPARAWVRGMGVAVMCSTCGAQAALPSSLPRCSTPNLH